MESHLITITEYCSIYEVEPEFIIKLESENLIEIQVIEDEQWIDNSQLKKLEQYIRWYYDLSINVEGIDVIQNLLDRIDNMQKEIDCLKERIKLIDEDF